MENLFQKKIPEIYEDIKKAFRERDYSSLLDYLVLLLFLSAIAFVISYKISTNLERLLFDSSTLVLSGRTKSHLPQLMLYALLGISFVKWILAVKTGNPKIGGDQKENINDSVDFHFKHTTYIIKKDTLYTIGLILIIFVFIVTKIPYWDVPFTHNHPLKYNTYVDPALSMYKNNDPFIIQRKYMHNPITDSKGIGTQYGNLPVLEWLLFVGYKIFMNILPMEAITRMVMILIGSTALVSFYYFVKKAFNAQYAIIGVFLLAFNAIFNLASFVTVYDTITFAFTFLSMSILIDILKKNSFQKLFLAGFIIGIGASIKENILIWAVPAALVFIFYSDKKSLRDFFTKTIIYLLGLFLPYFITSTSISYFPRKESKYFIVFFLFSIISVLLYKKINQISNIVKFFIFKIFDYLNNHKRLLWIIPILIFLVIKVVYSTSISEEFLTDFSLLFNVDLYTSFLNNQIIPYIGRILFYIFIPAITLFVIYSKNKRQNISILALICAVFFYIVVASKVLYFHSYYWIFILAVIYLIIAWTIIFFADLYKKIFKMLFLFLLLGSIFLYTSPNVKAKLNRQFYEVSDVIEYINSEDIIEGTSFIDQASLPYLTMKTSLYRVYNNTEVFSKKEFKESVQAIGFIESMKKYKILYLITNGTEPDYTIFANSFTIQNFESPSSRRTAIILSSLYNSEAYYPNIDEMNLLLAENHVSEQFRLIKDFGSFKIYKLADACFKTVIK